MGNNFYKFLLVKNRNKQRQKGINFLHERMMTFKFNLV